MAKRVYMVHVIYVFTTHVDSCANVKHSNPSKRARVLQLFTCQVGLQFSQINILWTFSNKKKMF